MIRIIFAVSRLVRDWTIYYLSHLVPRDEKVWVFIGWRFSKEREIFSDNSKYVFLRTANHADDIRAIWIGSDQKICDLLTDRGYEAYTFYSIKGIYFSLRAKYTFISAFMRHHNWRYCGGSKVVQLWHGKSTKKAGLQSPYSLSRRNRFRFPQLFQKFYKFVAVSEFLGKFTTKDFLVPEKTLMVVGAPKYDSMLSSIKDSDIDLDKNLEMLVDQIKKDGYSRTILYGPTFRPDGTTPLTVIDLNKLNNKLVETNDALVISLHPKFSTRDWIPEKSFSNIFFSQGAYDTYPIFNKFDLLISDYSSLCIDFIFLGKPVILFPYDIEKYKKDMGIYEELWEVLSVPKIYSFEELLESLEKDVSDLKTGIGDVRKKLFGSYKDSQASKRVVETILNSSR